jgi:lipid II:glycine glycyltransferase (peptidoglycan interpeptide bridge formation enzyme)
MASKGSVPVASILTLRFKNSLVYKYGCSDSQYSSLGGTPLLFWKVIQQAKESGVETFDLGRSAAEDAGLIAFKGHLGGRPTRLTYYRTPVKSPKKDSGSPSFAFAWAREAIGRLPDPLLAGIGQLLYRHIG